MGCFTCSSSKTPPSHENPEPKNVKHDLLFQLPECRVHFMDAGEALELSHGEFKILQIQDENVSLATIIRVGNDLQWPLTRDEPVVKLDARHYLFSLPMKDGQPLSYGVTFSELGNADLGLLDWLLKEHCCFNGLESSSSKKKAVDWKDYAPSVEDYNHFLAKAIAGGTGQIVKGIFKCSNAYTNKVQKGGEMILTRAADKKNGSTAKENYIGNRNSNGSKKSGINKSLKRVRKLSKATEKISNSMLNGVGLVSGSVMAPVVKSQAGKAFLTMLPGEVLLASLDAVNKVLDATEIAEKQAFSATSEAAIKIVTKRFGESAGEATEDVLASAGHCACAAWNIFKIRKAINPASSVSTGVLKTAAEDRRTEY